MDGFGLDEIPQEYAPLGDARQVMSEVVTLVDDLHRAATQLGDAIVAAGLPARAWRSADAWLPSVSDIVPEITLEDAIARLAEFSKGNAPHWLHGTAAEITRFNEEASILYGALRPLRVVAQRQRMLSARDRGPQPLARVLGDGRVGTQLDAVLRALRDLESLAPFIRPLAPQEWQTLTASPSQSVPEQQAPQAAAPDAFGAASPYDAAGQPVRRLFDYAPPPEMGGLRQPMGRGQVFSQALGRVRGQTQALRDTMRPYVQQVQPYLGRLQPYKWLVIGLTILLLAAGTGLLTLAVHQANSTPPSHLAATPARLALACSGKGATLTLRNSDTKAAAWSIHPPAGLRLSLTQGTLKPGASAPLTVTVTTAKAAHGTLTFTSGGGNASVPYTVACK